MAGSTLQLAANSSFCSMNLSFPANELWKSRLVTAEDLLTSKISHFTMLQSYTGLSLT